MSGPYETSPWCARWAPGGAVVDVARTLGAEVPAGTFRESWNAAHQHDYPILARDAAGEVVARAYGWGLGLPAGEAVARAEEMFVDRRIAPRIHRARCLVPAAAFYVGSTDDADPDDRRPPRAVRPPSGEPMALAGVWLAHRDRHARLDVVVRSFVILTRVACDEVKRYSPRMPVVLARHEWSRWLDPEAYGNDLGRLPSSRVTLTTYPVSEAVYGRADRRELLERVDRAE